MLSGTHEYAFYSVTRSSEWKGRVSAAWPCPEESLANTFHILLLISLSALLLSFSTTVNGYVEHGFLPYPMLLAFSA